MNKFAARYATDKKAEEEGQWVDFGDGIEVKLRRINSDFSREIRRKLEKPYANTYKGGREMPESLQEELLIKQLSQAVIVDWKGVTDDNEKALACTPDNVVRVCSMYKDFRDEIISASMERATFQAETVVAAEGNSKAA